MLSTAINLRDAPCQFRSNFLKFLLVVRFFFAVKNDLLGGLLKRYVRLGEIHRFFFFILNTVQFNLVGSFPNSVWRHVK